jgi:hypothetical protein
VACVGAVTGAWIAGELAEGLLLGVAEAPPEELAGADDELAGLEVPAPEVPERDDELVPDDEAEDFTAAWVEPGRTASTAPATPTLARDTVIVVVFRRRLPCSRSATARASSLLFMLISLARAAVRLV